MKGIVTRAPYTVVERIAQFPLGRLTLRDVGGYCRSNLYYCAFSHFDPIERADTEEKLDIVRQNYFERRGWRIFPGECD